MGCVVNTRCLFFHPSNKTCAFCLHVFSLVLFTPAAEAAALLRIPLLFPIMPFLLQRSLSLHPPPAPPFQPLPHPRVYHHFALERSSTSPPSPWKQWHNSRLAATAAWGRGVLTILCSCAVARRGLWRLSQIYEHDSTQTGRIVKTTPLCIIYEFL